MRRLMQAFNIFFILFVSKCFAQYKDPFSQNTHASSGERFIYMSIPLKHIYPEKAAQWLKNKSGALSKNEVVNAQYEQKALWLKINLEKENQLRQLIEKIDKPVPQVWIEARIVNVDEGCAQKLGLQLIGRRQRDKKDTPSLTIDGLHFPIVLAKLGSGAMLDLLLSALENNGHAKVVARPKLLVADDHEANIESGERVPYQVFSENNQTGIHFANAVLRLGVTPHVLADKRILLNLDVAQDKVGPLVVKGSPGITTQSLHTTVVVPEKNTVILGGIYEEKHSRDLQKIPWLAKVPVLGKLFIHDQHDFNRKELMIFITPRLVT